MNQIQAPNLKVNIAIIQPGNYIHSLAFLDPADSLRQWLNREGIPTSLTKNRLRRDAVNIIYGAHLGIPTSWHDPQYCNFFFNLEQIGLGGANITPQYLEILKTQNIIDYDVANVVSYRESPEEVSLVSFLNDPNLKSHNETPLEERPIDLLFFGCVNQKRQNFINKIESCGWDVTVFDQPTYAQERNNIIQQSKAVINTSFYESNRFEQIRAYSVLSMGTAFISEQNSKTKKPSGYEDTVFWLNSKEIDNYFKNIFATPTWYKQARQQLSIWRSKDASVANKTLLNRITHLWLQHHQNLTTKINSRNKILIPAPNEYRHNWWNISKETCHQPDIVLDFHLIQNWPYPCTTHFGENAVLSEGSIELVEVHQPTDTQTNLNTLLLNAFKLLKPSGILKFILKPPTTIRLPPQSNYIRFDYLEITHVSIKFWEAGLFNEKFVLEKCIWINDNYAECAREQATWLEIKLVKKETTINERNLARIYQPDFGLNTHTN